MDTKALMKGTLITLLNRSLDLQEIRDVRVLDLSDDYQVARVSHIRNGGRRVVGAVRAEIILSATQISSGML